MEQCPEAQHIRQAQQSAGARLAMARQSPGGTNTPSARRQTEIFLVMPKKMIVARGDEAVYWI
jgi:hypothetical protein